MEKTLGLTALLVLSSVSLVVADTGGTQQKNTQNEPQWHSQNECEKATGKECGFVMCDYVPKGKTYDETCGKVRKGWQPMPSQSRDQDK